jgi:hypothetical protein
VDRQRALGMQQMLARDRWPLGVALSDSLG